MAWAMTRSSLHWTSWFWHSSRPSITTSRGQEPCTSFVSMSKNNNSTMRWRRELGTFNPHNGSTRSSCIWIRYCLVNRSGVVWILSLTNESSPLKVLTNCKTRVGIKSFPLFLDASFLKKKKLVASSFFPWKLSASDCAIADFPTPALPYSQKMLACTPSQRSVSIHSSILQMIPSRVDSVHRGGSKHAWESNAALGEQCWQSSSNGFLDQSIWVMKMRMYLVCLKALDCWWTFDGWSLFPLRYWYVGHDYRNSRRCYSSDEQDWGYRTCRT